MEFIDFELKHLTATYKPKIVLDIGAGMLSQSLQMASEGIEVDAVEPRPPEGVSLPTNLHLYSVRAQDFDYKDNYYDLVIIRMVAQRLDISFAEKLFSELIPKTLKARAFLYLVIPNNYVVPTDLERNFVIRGIHDFDIPESDFKIIKSLILQKK